MAETRSTAAMAATNEAISSLRATSDHHGKSIQEMQKIQEIHTRTMNEMNQHLISILQKLFQNYLITKRLKQNLKHTENSCSQI